SLWYARELDDLAYLDAARFIKTWTPVVTDDRHHGRILGFPLAIAFVSRVCGVSERAALGIVCVLSSCVACWLLWRLYGWVVSVWVFIVAVMWVDLTVLGASEPLFLCLWLAAFLLARREQWGGAALAGALATTVRPVGVILLCVLGAFLIWRRSVRALVKV